jgi:hypothetical protein
MSKKARKLRREKKLDERCDKRSADFVVRQLQTIENSLADLIPDMQSLSRYDDITYTSLCLGVLKRLRKGYKKIADGQTWRDEDCD